MRGDLFFYLNNKNYTKSKWKYRRVFFINKIALDLHIKDVITEIRMTSKLDKLTNAASVRCRITFSPFLFKNAFRARDYLSGKGELFLWCLYLDRNTPRQRLQLICPIPRCACVYSMSNIPLISGRSVCAAALKKGSALLELFCRKCNLKCVSRSSS